MDKIVVLLQKIVSIIWGPATVVIFLGVGLYFTLGTGVLQLRRPGLWLIGPLKLFVNKGNKQKRGVLCTVLGATAGTGNIVGVAAALAAGGPGAVFWMWASAFFGMALGYAENVLGAHYSSFEDNKKYNGGAALYIKYGMGEKRLAKVFLFSCALASFGIGNLTQGNSLTEGIAAMAHSFNAPFSSTARIVVGIALMCLAAPAIFGGAKKIADTSARIVPFAVVGFVLLSVIIIATNYRFVIPAFCSIFREAFNFRAAATGTAGYGIATAVRVGLSRGLFSHEAGMGSSVAVHTNVKSKSVTEQGFWSMFEVFADTIVICTLTALVILTSGAYSFLEPNADGATLTAMAFTQSFGKAGGIFVCLMLCIFGFQTILGWGCFGQNAAGYLNKRLVLFYKIIYVSAIPLGCVLKMQMCWYAADIFNWLMAIPNIIAITVCSKTVFRISRQDILKEKR